MAALTRSASLTNFSDVARKAGLDARRVLSEFGLPPHCLTDPDLKVPIDAVRRLLEACAERSAVRCGIMIIEHWRFTGPCWTRPGQTRAPYPSRRHWWS